MPGPESAAEWVDALLDLLGRSVEERVGLGRRARQVVRERYSYDAWLPRWKEAVGISGAAEHGG